MSTAVTRRCDRPAALDEAAIRHYLGDRRIAPASLDILQVVDSTNRYLLETLPAAATGAVCLAEVQSEGRGRHGRQWISTPYSNILLSFAWQFEAPLFALAGLSLAAGLAVLRALEDYGVSGATLKWPNDINWSGRKLCGVLTESRPDAGRGVRVVIGAGINVCIDPEAAARIDQPWVDLREIVGDIPDRNRLAADVIAQLWVVCERYSVSGFELFRADWNARHGFDGKAVEWQDGGQARQGVVLGVDADGALRIRDNAGDERAFHSGEISLRARVT